MGMYDYFGKYQIKIFGVPIFYESNLYGGISLMGGKLITYNKGDKLPLRELWYKYPNNFIVLDNNTEEYEDNFRWLVHIIKDGKYFNTVELKDFNNKDLGQATYDYHGNLLNIKSKDDMYKVIGLKNEHKDKQNKLEKSYFPEGVFECINTNIQKYDYLEKEYDNKLNEINKKYNKQIYLKNKDYDVCLFGEYLNLAIDAYNTRDKEKDSFRDYEQYYTQIKTTMKDFLNSQPKELLNKYFAWVGDLIPDVYIDTVKSFINNEVLK